MIDEDTALALVWLALMLLAAVWVSAPIVRRYGAAQMKRDPLDLARPGDWMPTEEFRAKWDDPLNPHAGRGMVRGETPRPFGCKRGGMKHRPGRRA